MNIEDKEQISTLIDQRIEDKIKHNESSPETKQFMQKINVELNYIKEKLSKVPTLSEMNLANEHLVERVMKDCEKKFASKLTERIVFGIMGAGGLTVVIWILGLIRN